MFITLAIADAQVHLIMQQCELLWYPTYTDFMKTTSIVDDFAGRTMTNLQTVCHFVISHSSYRTMSRAHSMLSLSVWLWTPFSCVTLVRPVFNVSSHL
jgi:hypothetical protein